jgi:hypothetical protein
MLTKREIRQLLQLLLQVVVVEATGTFPFTISHKITGYSQDTTISQLQAKLSMMLEAAKS